MSEAHDSESFGSEGGQADRLSVLFAQLVMQQANMATMFLGKVAHPETGEVVKNIDAARLFIDQLEMLEAKTKGNLDKDEAALLKQSLMSLRMAFVEAVEAGPAAGETEPKPQPEAAPVERAPGANPSNRSEEEEHRKKFSKKY
jgi:Domain of unknown function (DUF1844)